MGRWYAEYEPPYDPKVALGRLVGIRKMEATRNLNPCDLEDIISLKCPADQRFYLTRFMVDLLDLFQEETYHNEGAECMSWAMIRKKGGRRCNRCRHGLDQCRWQAGRGLE